jgi:ribosomal subunit interface protein
MRINITGHETALTPEIKKYTETKLNKLCKKYKQILSADVVIEENHNKTEKTAAVAKVLLKIKGQDISATAEAKTVFAAIDETERKLLKQLDRDKAKHDVTKRRFVKSKEIIRNLFTRNEQ